MSPQGLDAQLLMRGVKYKVSSAVRGDHVGPATGRTIVWHAYVSGVTRADLQGLAMLPAARDAHHIAQRVEREVEVMVRQGDDERAARRLVLNQFADRYPVRPQGDSASWCEVGYCFSEDEARERACEVIGYVFGRRLARATAGYVPEPEPVAAVREAVFS